MTHAVSTATIVALRAEGLSIRAIAEREKVSPGTIEYRLRKEGEPSRAPSKRGLDLVAAYREHGTFRNAGVALGVSGQAVYAAVLRYERRTGENLPRNVPVPRTGPLMPSAKCRKIIAAYLSAGSLSAAARSLGMAPSAVHQMVVRYERATGEKLPRYPRGRPGRKL